MDTSEKEGLTITDFSLFYKWPTVNRPVNQLSSSMLPIMYVSDSPKLWSLQSATFSVCFFFFVKSNYDMENEQKYM